MKPGQWTLETIGPDEAEALLASMGRNRRPNTKRAEQYARAQRDKRWLLTHQGICIHNDQLIDGQHRMHAVIMSGIPMLVWVYRSHDDNAFVHQIDRHQARTDTQAAVIAGTEVTSAQMSVVRVLEYGRKAFKMSFSFDASEVIGLVEKHRPTLEWMAAAQLFKKTKGLTQAPISGAIGRAYLCLGDDVASRFAHAYMSGIVSGPEESAVGRLREFALSLDRTSERRETVYLKACAAILAFAQRRKLTKLYATESPDDPLK